MTVLAKPSADRVRGRGAAAPAAVLCAITISALMIGGCSSGGAAPTPATGTRDPGHSTPSARPSQRACSTWAGLDDLASITTWLRQLIGDEVIFGASTEQAKQDGLTILVYADTLDGLWEKLPPPYAQELRDAVLSVAASPYKKTPEQLNTAANAAQNLAAQIGNLCL